MSALDRLKDGLTNKAVVVSVPDSSNSGTGPHGAGILSFGIDKAERILAAGGFGFIKGRFRDKSLIFSTLGKNGQYEGGVPVDILAGTVLTLVAAGLNLATDGKSALAKHAERIGDAGVMSFFNSLGASWGAKSANYQVAVLPATMKLPPGAAPMVLGALPQAAGGAYLTAEEIAKYSASKG